MIQIDIDMPKNCFECDKTYKWKKDGKVQCPHINMPSISSNTTNRPSYCPLKEVPSRKWIPVSERLPKIADVYRVTRYYPNNVMNPKYLVDACAFDGSNTWYNDNRINHERAYVDNIIAWQENPEPYEPHESEGKEVRE